MLSTYNEQHLIEKARSAGANGYLLKNHGRDELIRAIRVIMSGENYFIAIQADCKLTPKTDDIFLKQFNLTRREKEIICLVKQHFTNQEISEQLFLSIYTIETHRKNIMQKLSLKSPAALMQFIMQHEL